MTFKKTTMLSLLLFLSTQTLFSAESTQKQVVIETDAPKINMRADNNVQDMKVQNRKIAALAAKELSKTLPQTIDKYTKLVDVRNEDLTLVYVFEINTGSKSDETVQKEDHARMQSAVEYGVCRSSKRFLDAQIDISYLYQSAKSKAKLFQFDITQTDCVGMK